jgi:hypothetical protein
MSARCKALCKKTHFHYGFVTKFSGQRCKRADVDLNSTIAPDAMSRSFGAAQMADSQGTAIVRFVRRAIGLTEDPMAGCCSALKSGHRQAVPARPNSAQQATCAKICT